eukprot:COSAG04_NODE_2596_length_3876_cov_3.004766_5_plen_76_part_00
MPTAILGAIPSSNGARKFDANNCGYNPVHTDMIGGSWEYPEANYSRRKEIWQAHVDYVRRRRLSPDFIALAVSLT